MTFARPDMAWATPLAVALVVVALAAFARRRRALGRAFGGREASLRLAGVDLLRFPALRLLFCAAAALALGLAAAGPRRTLEPPPIPPYRPLDLVVAVDISTSMYAEDEKPNRLDRAKAIAHRLMDEFPAERVGVVAFAQQGYRIVPPTEDHAVVAWFLDALQPELLMDLDQGTRISMALTETSLLFQEWGRKDATRALVLLSDGEDYEEELLALEAADSLAAQDVKVYSVGLGSDAGSTVVSRNALGKPSGTLRDGAGQPVHSRLGASMLRAIAREGNGEYLTAGSRDVDRLADALGRRPRSAPAPDGSYWSTVDLVFALGVVALLLVLADTVTAARAPRRRRDVQALPARPKRPAWAGEEGA